jgi:DNA-directed RNA polymerase specialized sigma24 family protein
VRFADGLTFAEIAEKRGQSLEAVKSLYRRAIQALKDEMGMV